MDNSIGIYIHIPFCKSKCYYCDFNSYSGREYLAGPYFNALLSELVNSADILSGRQVRTIFIGGGTPSLVDPKYISSLLDACTKYFNVDPDAEISLESNPGTLTHTSLEAYRAAGVNRLSIGLQAWQDSLLESMGRIHRRQQFVDNLKAAYKAGFRNINADLIFGLPGQTFEDWTETLSAVTTLGSDNGLAHLSCYSLKIEEGTNFGDRYTAGTLEPADDELDRRMYRYTIETLAQKGYKHYEISNFAKPGFECKHNLVYWKALEYAGFGAGAHSYLDCRRFSNVEGIEEYIAAVKQAGMSAEERKAAANEQRQQVEESAVDVLKDILHNDLEFINRQDSMSEFMILGLRLIDGISEEDFQCRFGVSLMAVYGDKLEKLVREGFLINEQKKGTELNMPNKDLNTSNCFKLTTLGLDFANKVFVEFI